MQLSEIPDQAFDVRVKAGQVVHYKISFEIEKRSRADLLKEIERLGDGEIRSITPTLHGFKAVFVQAVNLPRA